MLTPAIRAIFKFLLLHKPAGKAGLSRRCDTQFNANTRRAQESVAVNTVIWDGSLYIVGDEVSSAPMGAGLPAREAID
jgi:hypothetical protein